MPAAIPRMPKFSQGQSANLDREGSAEFKTKKKTKARKAPVKPSKSAPPIGGFGVGMPT